jgi:hypothetical protein
MLHLPALPSDTLGRIMTRADGTYRLIAFYSKRVPGFGSFTHTLWAFVAP